MRVGKQCLDNVLAVVKRSLDTNVVDVLIKDGTAQPGI